MIVPRRTGALTAATLLRALGQRRHGQCDMLNGACFALQHTVEHRTQLIQHVLANRRLKMAVLRFNRKIAYHDFEGITVHPDEGKRILASTGDKHLNYLNRFWKNAWQTR